MSKYQELKEVFRKELFSLKQEIALKEVEFNKFKKICKIIDNYIELVEKSDKDGNVSVINSEIIVQLKKFFQNILKNLK